MDLAFPTDVREFDGDDRISFSKLTSKFIAVHEDGSEYEFDADSKKWLPTEDGPTEHEHFDEGGLDSFGVGSEISQTENAYSKKRKTEADNGVEPMATRSSRPAKKQKAPPQPRQNTAVYVTGLPLNADVDEVHEVFSRKGGVIAEQIDSGAPRITLYKDADGNFKGDALIVFFKPESVQQAITLLDDSDFRILPNGARDGHIRVQAADSSYKKVQYNDQGPGNGTGGGQQGERRHHRNERDRQKIIKKTQKLDAKLADWSDDEPYPAPADAVSKWDKMVILRHMFTLEELDETPSLLLEIKQDIREECEKLGTVTSVVLYEQEPQGIVRVKFKEAEAAEACVQRMHGRNYAGQTVDASLATGREKFRKSDGGDSD